MTGKYFCPPPRDIGGYRRHLSPQCSSISWPSHWAAKRSSSLSLPSPGSSWPAHYTGGGRHLSASLSSCSSPAVQTHTYKIKLVISGFSMTDFSLYDCWRWHFSSKKKLFVVWFWKDWHQHLFSLGCFRLQTSSAIKLHRGCCWKYLHIASHCVLLVSYTQEWLKNNHQTAKWNAKT